MSCEISESLEVFQRTVAFEQEFVFLRVIKEIILRTVYFCRLNDKTDTIVKVIEVRSPCGASRHLCLCGNRLPLHRLKWWQRWAAGWN